SSRSPGTSRTTTVFSPTQKASTLPSALSVSAVTRPFTPPRRRNSLPVATSQVRTPSLSLDENRVLLSGVQASERTHVPCFNARSSRPVSASQSRTNLSCPPVASVLPSGENAAHSILPR